MIVHARTRTGLEKWRHRVAVTAAVVALTIVGTAAPDAHAAVSPENLNSYTNWSLGEPGSGFTTVDGRMSITEDPGTDAGYYFYATVATLSDGHGTYIGLQNDGLYATTEGPGERVGRMAIFSVWGGLGAAPGFGGWCVDFDESGTGKSCRIRYPWVAGHVYRTRLERVPFTSLLNGSVIDETTGAETFIGQISSADSALLPNDVSNFLERSGYGFPDCGGLPRTTVSFYAPIGDGAVATLTGNSQGPGGCSSLRSVTPAEDHVDHSMGTDNRSCQFLYAGYALIRGRSIVSCDGAHLLVHQTDGNVVLYALTLPYDKNTGSYLWDTGTGGQATTRLIMQKDGNLVLYGPRGYLWASWTQNHPGAFLKVQGDGRLGIYEGDESAWLWGAP